MQIVLAALIALACGIAMSAFPARGLAAEVGIASYYGPESGRVTASGERFAWGPGCRTAAHRTLPFGTRVRVTVLATGRSVVVRITDRGPARWTGRIIDLCQGAGHALGLRGPGVARVRVEVLHGHGN